MFNELSFDIYITRALMEVEDEEQPLARDVEAKHVTSKVLNVMRTRFYEVIELFNSLDEEARDRLLGH